MNVGMFASGYWAGGHWAPGYFVGWQQPQGLGPILPVLLLDAPLPQMELDAPLSRMEVHR